MSRIIDERFLAVHPRTALWWEQRKLCRSCFNYTDHGAGRGESCEAVPGGPRGGTSCIEARDTQCGSKAVLFVARRSFGLAA
jgi:hypothetical protein